MRVNYYYESYPQTYECICIRWSDDINMQVGAMFITWFIIPNVSLSVDWCCFKRRNTHNNKAKLCLFSSKSLSGVLFHSFTSSVSMFRRRLLKFELSVLISLFSWLGALRGGFTWGQKEITPSPDLGLTPSDELKASAYRCKTWLRNSVGLRWEAYDAPQTPLSRFGGHPSPYHIFDSPPSALATFGAWTQWHRVGGGKAYAPGRQQSKRRKRVR